MKDKEKLSKEKAEKICMFAVLISIEAFDFMMRGYDLNEY